MISCFSSGPLRVFRIDDAISSYEIGINVDHNNNNSAKRPIDITSREMNSFETEKNYTETSRKTHEIIRYISCKKK